jgi:putative SOS response-associated peptidase YedK
MCGRFTLTDPARLIDAYPQFRFPEFSETRLPRFNIAPTQTVLGVRNGRSDAEEFRWGFLPYGGANGGFINARAESIATKPAFRKAFRDGRRAVIFANGFFEWKSNRPTFFSLRDRKPFAFAALWTPADHALPTPTLITCMPNELVSRIHDDARHSP